MCGSLKFSFFFIKKKENALENVKETSYNSSIQKPILCSNILEPSQTFFANSRNKACEKLSKLEGIHIPSYSFDYKMVNYTLTSGFFLMLTYPP